jgi:hypothetical protein
VTHGHASLSEGVIDYASLTIVGREVDRQGRRWLQVADRHLGGHYDRSWAPDADRPGRTCGVRARANPCPYR